jgi:hypothetical protein
MKRKLLVGSLVLLVAMQLVTCERTNPPITGDLTAPPEVASILRRACYDCHSNETVWPWYSRVAPISWLVHRDVVDGRRHLNFSEWDKVPTEKRARKINAASHQAKEGEMPPWFYLPMHWNARVADAERAILERWALSQ